MSTVQTGRLRIVVAALTLLFCLSAGMLAFSIRQLAQLPQEAALQAAIASIDLDDAQRAAHAPPPFRVLGAEQRLAEASDQWVLRLKHLENAMARLEAQEGERISYLDADGVDALEKAWRDVRRTLQILAEPAPEYFVEIAPDGSRSDSEEGRDYLARVERANEAAEVQLAAFAQALAAARKATAKITADRVERLQLFQNGALAAGVLLFAILSLYVLLTRGRPERAVSVEQRESHDIQNSQAASSEPQMDLPLPMEPASHVATIPNMSAMPAAGEVSAALAQIGPVIAEPAVLSEAAAVEPPPACGDVVTNTIVLPESAAIAAKQAEAARPQAATEPPAPTYDPVGQALSSLAARIAADLGKDVRLDTMGLDRLPPEYSASIREILMQLICNAIVHGVETPSERKAAGKAAIGAIRVELMTDEASGMCHIDVEDDGRGLSREKIRAAAIRKGIVASAEEAARLDGLQLIALLFQRGFTTAEVVTPHAGRGVGMDTVKTVVDSFGGRVGVATKPGRHTRFRITLPLTRSAVAAA